jgi:phospholipid-binding lipoprotein MlaA
MPATNLRYPLLALALLFLFGCASLPPNAKRDPRDPWEGMNRSIYKFNAKVDRGVLRPVAVGYRKVTPQFVRTGVSNFFDNLGYPVVIVNDVLQAQFKPFLNDTGRLLMNTTLGLGGLFDPASAAGLDKNERDFGQTLGKWGIGAGPYLMIPLVGPSDVRDAVGRVGDEFSSPRHYINNNYWDYGLFAVGVVDTRYRLLDTDQLVYNAYDPYAFLRNAYLQRREFKVHGAKAQSNEAEQEEKLLEEAGEDSGGDQQPPPPQPPPK